MTKISPVAAYLTANKAITKREGKNVWHFFSPEGLYLGKQVAFQRNGSTGYCREIYGEGMKKLYYECKVLTQICSYFKNMKSPLGLSVIPVKTYLLFQDLDYLNNTSTTHNTLRLLENNAELYTIDPDSKMGIFRIKEDKFEFKDYVLEHKTEQLKKGYHIEHTKH